MESLKKKSQRANSIYQILDPLYTHDKTALKYRTPIELLAATILSLQCTDKQVNEVTKTFSQKVSIAEDFLNRLCLRNSSRTSGRPAFSKQNKILQGCCRGLVDLWGRVLLPWTNFRLPGVVERRLIACWELPSTFLVVVTLTKRLGISSGTHDELRSGQTKRILGSSSQKKGRTVFDLLIYHGREVCKARKPEHPGVRSLISAPPIPFSVYTNSPSRPNSATTKV
jgi:endonuclease-3